MIKLLVIIVTMSIVPIFAQFKIVASKELLKNKIGTEKVKCSFIANNNLWILDFSEDVPICRLITTDTLPAAPMVSPDGNCITYTTGILNEPPMLGKTKAWFMDLRDISSKRLVDSISYNPRFKQNDSTHSIIYSTKGYPLSGKMYAWDGSGVVMCKSMKDGKSDTIWRGGSWFGGLSYDNKWLCTAESGENAFMINITSDLNTPKFLHTIPVKKTFDNRDTSIALQTCNPSISTSQRFPDAMMYYDFSSETIENAKCISKEFGIWGQHQRIFISRANGSIVKYFDPPATDYPLIPEPVGKGEVVGLNWSNPEWSNHPYYAASGLLLYRSWKIANAFDVKGKCEAIYLLNLYDSTYIKLLEIDSISSDNKSFIEYPFIWVATPDNFGSIEDQFWLDNPIKVIKNEMIKNGTNYTKHFRISDGVFKSKVPVKQLDVFLLNGKQIFSFKDKPSKEIPLSISLKNNITLFNVIFHDNKRYSFSCAIE